MYVRMSALSSASSTREPNVDAKRSSRFTPWISGCATGVAVAVPTSSGSQRSASSTYACAPIVVEASDGAAPMRS